MKVRPNISVRSCSQCCSGKAQSITYCKCVFVALVIRHRMRRIIICSLPRSAIVFHILINGTILEKEVTKYKIFVLIYFTTFSETFLILRRIQRDMIIHVYRSSSTVPVIVVRFWWNFNFHDRFWKKKCPNVKFHENPSNGIAIVPCERTDRQISNSQTKKKKKTFFSPKAVAGRAVGPSWLYTDYRPYFSQASSKDCGQPELWISSQAVHSSCNLLIWTTNTFLKIRQL